MINRIVYVVFFSVLSFDYMVHHLSLAPRVLTWAPEFIGIFLSAVIVLCLIHQHKLEIATKYIYLIALYLTILIVGILFSDSSIKTTLVGLRVHLKFLPFFLLPAVYAFSNEQLKYQLLFLFPLLVLQTPLALYQRFIQFRHLYTGDVISGTMGVSGSLSILMVCCISVLLGLYMKKCISRKTFLLSAIAFLIPTIINETKVTLFLLPIALAAPLFFFQKSSNKRMKAVFVSSLIGILSISVFIPAYDYMYPRSKGIVGFLQSEKDFNRYFFPGRYETGDFDVRRGDAILFAFKNLTKDPVHFFFGLGTGSTKVSFDRSLSGEHADRARRAGANAMVFTYHFWEIGLLGFAVYALFYWFILRDAVAMMRVDGFFGPFALGWTGVVLVMGIALFYSSYIHNNALNLLFWYFSGIVASRAYRMRLLLRSQYMRVMRYDRAPAPDIIGTRA